MLYDEREEREEEGGQFCEQETMYILPKPYKHMSRVIVHRTHPIESSNSHWLMQSSVQALGDARIKIVLSLIPIFFSLNNVSNLIKFLLRGGSTRLEITWVQQRQHHRVQESAREREDVEPRLKFHDNLSFILHLISKVTTALEYHKINIKSVSFINFPILQLNF